MAPRDPAADGCAGRIGSRAKAIYDHHIMISTGCFYLAHLLSLQFVQFLGPLTSGVGTFLRVVNVFRFLRFSPFLPLSASCGCDYAHSVHIITILLYVGCLCNDVQHVESRYICLGRCLGHRLDNRQDVKRCGR